MVHNRSSPRTLAEMITPNLIVSCCSNDKHYPFIISIVPYRNGNCYCAPLLLKSKRNSVRAVITGNTTPDNCIFPKDKKNEQKEKNIYQKRG